MAVAAMAGQKSINGASAALAPVVALAVKYCIDAGGVGFKLA